jgi:hypothetical protein
MTTYLLNMTINDFITAEYKSEDGSVRRCFFKTFIIFNQPYYLKIVGSDLLMASNVDSIVVMPAIWSPLVIDDEGNSLRLGLFNVYNKPATDYTIDQLGGDWKVCVQK